ncbi:IQ calmodulin-binding motif protein [Penicillium citrinum]|uniref:IQ calmodulin-binding motif protein n=2 Tax=Penicillium TaxID=5073 RepID=A0A9W9PFE0_PENCI|nr:IQ calmodulin-binding motif protein [Penicillium citrinum]KAJ5243456.1 IQ calmodulin-binding motif protein [Penicillium citrinum]KAJ5599036.1 IQ calmodulin-binding motif protein [Penicillium hetheringtonii]
MSDIPLSWESPKPPDNGNDVTDSREIWAAGLIQRMYRGYRTRRELQGNNITASSRWMDMNNQRYGNDLDKLESTESDQITSPARKNWQRAVSVAIQAGAIDDSASPAPPKRDDHVCQGEIRREATKIMDLPYFLEMVDGKHRHGSNLRAYHAIWKNAPSNENFFYWLDYGEGKNVELPHCPRERLERDQVRYLSPEERLKYLVKVDDEGLFRWAKNDELVYTNNKQFKDSMQGVVSVNEGASKFRGNTESPSIPPSPPSPSASSPIPVENKENSDPHLSTREDYEFGKAVSKFSRIKPTALYEHFAGDISLHDDMWIFVADTSFRIYVGIKEPGAFQHSSFLRGGRISAAGMLKIKHGQLRSLAPLSGHYRPHLAHFRAFHHSLQERGVDLSRVSMSKSYAILAGIEGYTLTKKKFHDAHEKLDTAKEKIQKFHITEQQDAKANGD